jgi:hypothetical protein
MRSKDWRCRTRVTPHGVGQRDAKVWAEGAGRGQVRTCRVVQGILGISCSDASRLLPHSGLTMWYQWGHMRARVSPARSPWQTRRLHSTLVTAPAIFAYVVHSIPKQLVSSSLHHSKESFVFMLMKSMVFAIVLSTLCLFQDVHCICMQAACCHL